MKLSTRARYGLRLCYILAVSKNGSESIKSMAVESNLSEKYLEKIIAKLKKGNIVIAKRGQCGGYSLGRKPDEITVNQVLQVMDDTFNITACATGGCADKKCPNKHIFSKLYDKINIMLDCYTLQDMIDEQGDCH